MPTNILQKALDELGKESPDISYVKGMLETIIELQDKATNADQLNAQLRIKSAQATTTQSNEHVDEGALLDARAKAAIESVRKLTDKSVETI